MLRPIKLTPEVQKRICDAIAAGNYRETAASYAGVSGGTLYRWMQQGQRSAQGPTREFYEAVKKADAEAEARNVAIIERAAIDTWQAAAWWLERRYPDRWGKRERHEVTGEGGGEIKIRVVYDS